ncbi:arylamine N-acetyltransferase family protein [Gaoshiqia sp. Z1-71]|uniref:arylamine N-acetyltransferase family protein n=1 Tax=Gaoshiqia hydrogeniformans TaxID=3290090 RepID=UPI003BF8973D
MKTEIDLNAYFDRIGYDGPRAATLDVLKKLHFLHPLAIAFENLNPLLRIPVLLDSKSLQQKLIYENRGGYCFEQNLLFMDVLRSLGFWAKGLAARVLWNVPEGRITPRGHMLILVEAESKKYICDVGFGGMVLTAPLLLEPVTAQETPHEPFKLTREGEEYILFTRIDGEWKALYRFNLSEHYREDYQLTNWYLSNHPESHFVTGLIAARPDINPSRRYTLRGNQFSIHYLHGQTEKRTLETVTELRQILERYFLIRLSDVPELDAVLQKIIVKMEGTA